MLSLKVEEMKPEEAFTTAIIDLAHLDGWSIQPKLSWTNIPASRIASEMRKTQIRAGIVATNRDRQYMVYRESPMADSPLTNAASPLITFKHELNVVFGNLPNRRTAVGIDLIHNAHQVRIFLPAPSPTFILKLITARLVSFCQSPLFIWVCYSPLSVMLSVIARMSVTPRFTMGIVQFGIGVISRFRHSQSLFSVGGMISSKVGLPCFNVFMWHI